MTIAPAAHEVRGTHGLWPSLLLGLSLLPFCIYAIAWTLPRELFGDKILHSVLSEDDWGTRLPLRIAVFAVTVVLVHALLGVAAFVLARAGELAWRFDDQRRKRYILLWFAALVVWVFAANQSWYPSSRFHATGYDWIATPLLTPTLSVFSLYSGLLATAVGVTVAVAAYRSSRWQHLLRQRQLLIASTALAGVTLALAAIPDSFGGSMADQNRPNVILIGVDSLRCDVTAISGRESLTPHIDAFLRPAHVFTDAISPLARTYPAWVSILTGRHPRTTGARFNLMPRDRVQESDTLADALHARGYQTVFATDEVRFANIDESFGFDQLITPRIGATDFLLGTLNDLPLTNLVGSSILGKWLFPDTYANRGAAVTYEPEDFLERIDDELVVRGPVFVVAHLTLAHYPYSWAGQTTPSNQPAYRASYPKAVAEVDRQFQALIEILEDKGLLDNALVVVLSDHGEALGKANDSLLRTYKSDNDELWNSLWGHGTSVMSPHQFGVVLAFRGFGAETLPLPTRAHDVPASLEDIRPTVLELVTGEGGHHLDGRSLRQVLINGPVDGRLTNRLRFTETDFNTPRVLRGKYDRDGLLQEGAAYYEVVPESGWLQLRKDKLPELLRQKERAVMSATQLLGALPDRQTGETVFLLTDRRRPFPERLTGRPDPAARPEAARLWDALHERFRGEL